MAEFAKMHDVVLKNSTPYRPEENGQVERSNQTFKEKLFAVAGDDINNWDKHLKTAVRVYNEATHSTIKVHSDCIY